MSWDKLSDYATGISGSLAWTINTWHHVFHSPWHWLLLLFILASIAAIVRSRYEREIPIDDLWNTYDPEVKSTKDSPFFAYLGHNILTEGCAKDPHNTSVDAIGRIPEHVLLRNVMLPNISEEPLGYDDEGMNTSYPAAQYQRRYTYPDTKNEQIRDEQCTPMAYDQPNA